MAGLMDLLAKGSGTSPGAASSDPMAPPTSDTGFEESAAQLMDCLKSNDVAGFAEALKACIEMGGSDGAP